MSHRLALSVVVAALLAGAGIRVVRAATVSLWMDEVFTIRRTSGESTGEVVSRLRGSPFPPAHYIAVRAWRELWNDAAFGVRGVSLLCGLAAIPVTFFVWRPMLGESTAVVASVVTACSAYHVWYSTDAKMYAGVWLLTVISLGYFLRLLKAGGRSGKWSAALYGGSTALLPLTSYTAAAVPAVEATFLLGAGIFRPEWRKNAALTGALLLVSLLPAALWAVWALDPASGTRGLDWIGPSRIESFWHDIAQLCGLFVCGFREDNHGALSTTGSVLIALQSLCLVVLLCGLTAVMVRTGPARRDARLREAQTVPEQTMLREALPERNSEGVDAVPPLRAVVLAFLLWGFALPILTAFVVSLDGASVWNVARYLTPSAVCLTLLLSVVACGGKSRPGRLLLIVPWLTVNLALCSFDWFGHTRIPWHTIAKAVAQASPDRAAVLLWEDDGKLPTVIVEPRYALRRVRESNRSGTSVTEGIQDQIADPAQWAGTSPEAFLLESIRQPPADASSGFRHRHAGRLHFERLASWPIYGTGDLPNPSVVRSVTLWRISPYTEPGTEGG